MDPDEVDPDELIVKGEYWKQVDSDSPSSLDLQPRLRRVLSLEGYRSVSPKKESLGFRTINYAMMDEPRELSFVEKVFGLLGADFEEKRVRETYFDSLEKKRKDVPFQISFQVRRSDLDDQTGLRITITAKPTVLVRIIQTDFDESFNKKLAVRTCKEAIGNIAMELGWLELRPPWTPAEALNPTLSDEVRETLENSKYGYYVIHYCDEGDAAMKYRLEHSALASYVHAIEWAIITHVLSHSSIDLIEHEEEQFEGGRGLHFGGLVQRLDHHGDASQRSIEYLNELKTTRNWMGHHKSGELATSDVHRMKERLEFLTRELF